MLALTYIHSGFLYSVLAFLLVGAIPGTSLSLPPIVMLTLYEAIALLIALGFLLNRIIRSVNKNGEHTQQHLPHRRLSRI